MEIEEIADAVPTSWLDQLLSGPGKTITDADHINGLQLEKLLRQVKARVLDRIREYERQDWNTLDLEPGKIQPIESFEYSAPPPRLQVEIPVLDAGDLLNFVLGREIKFYLEGPEAPTVQIVRIDRLELVPGMAEGEELIRVGGQFVGRA